MLIGGFLASSTATSTATGRYTATKGILTAFACLNYAFPIKSAGALKWSVCGRYIIGFRLFGNASHIVARCGWVKSTFKLQNSKN